MNKNQAEYKNIVIYRKECDNYFLLLYNNKTLSVGYLVKDILVLLQEGVYELLDIKEKICQHCNIELELSEIKKIILMINKFISDSSNSFFIKIGKIINPGIIKGNIDFIFEKYIFYSSFIVILILNILFAFILPHSNILAFKEWIIYIVLLLLISFFHELGHALSARKYEINCEEIGIGLYIIFPILYTNIGESWRLKRWKRIIINLSGIFFQLVFGIIIGSFAFFTESGVLYILFFTNFIISLLNLNPFIKFDGYWVLSDILDIKNLSKSAHNEINHLLFLNIKAIKDRKLLIYSLMRFIFITFMIISFIYILKDIIIKMLNNKSLFYDEYFIIIVSIFYILISLKDEYSSIQKKYMEKAK